jgi:hypothetical protein
MLVELMPKVKKNVGRTNAIRFKALLAIKSSFVEQE